VNFPTPTMGISGELRKMRFGYYEYTLNMCSFDNGCHQVSVSREDATENEHVNLFRSSVSMDAAFGRACAWMYRCERRTHRTRH
jgi:hypothetical protein